MKKALFIIGFILLILLAERFFFNTTDLKVTANPDHLYASPASSMTISITPINYFDYKNPLGSVNVVFEVDDGMHLVKIEETTESTAKIVSIGLPGEATIGIYSAKSGMLIKRMLIRIYDKELALIL